MFAPYTFPDHIPENIIFGISHIFTLYQSQSSHPPVSASGTVLWPCSLLQGHLCHPSLEDFLILPSYPSFSNTAIKWMNISFPHKSYHSIFYKKKYSDIFTVLQSLCNLHQNWRAIFSVMLAKLNTAWLVYNQCCNYGIPGAFTVTL